MIDAGAMRSAVASALRVERARAHVTQQQVADGAGLSKVTIVRLEAGRRDATLLQLSACADALGVPLLYLVGEVVA